MGPSELDDIEQIRVLKARYFRLLDTKRWGEWSDLLTDDCHADFGVDVVLDGRDAIAASVRRFLADGISVHQGFMPEIAITGPATATGTWAMCDRVDWPDGRRAGFVGYGHYEESYRKGDDGRWRIASLKLTRLLVEAT